MSILQIILIALFIYLGAIGSIIGNTIGWYTLGRPLAAAFVVGLIMGDVQTAMLVGIPLQIAFLVNVTPGGTVAWDLSYATYIGTAMAIVMKNTVTDSNALVGLAFAGAGIGGVVGGAMWNIHYALNVPLNRWANRLANDGECRKMWMPNVLGGQITGFLCRFVPAIILLVAINLGTNIVVTIPEWITTVITTFGNMMSALGMGIVLSFLIKKTVHWAIFVGGFILITYFKLSVISVAVIGMIASSIYYYFLNRDDKKKDYDTTVQEDTSEDRNVSTKAFRKAFINWFFWNGCSQQAESMQGIAFGHSMAPVIDELYETKEKKADALKRHITLFNTEVQTGTICNGICIGMEERLANGHGTAEAISDTKVALIGTVSSIGDSLWVATIIPLLLTLCVSLSQALPSAAWIGALTYILIYPIGTYFMSWSMFKLGYKTGLNGMLRLLSSGKMDRIISALTVLSLMVVGALTASYVICTLNIDIKIGTQIFDVASQTYVKDTVSILNLDTIFDSIFPKIIPLGLTLFVYRLHTKKNFSPLLIMGIILALAFILTGIGYIPSIGVYA